MNSPAISPARDGFQVAIRCSKDDRDRDLQATECAAVDELVLLVQGIKKTGRPGANGGEGVRLIDAGEELRQD